MLRDALTERCGGLFYLLATANNRYEIIELDAGCAHHYAKLAIVLNAAKDDIPACAGDQLGDRAVEMFRPGDPDGLAHQVLAAQPKIAQAVGFFSVVWLPDALEKIDRENHAEHAHGVGDRVADHRL